MRIAVCFSGQIRTGVQTAPNILRYIGDLRSECDIFVHTWDIRTDPQQQRPEDPNLLIDVDKRIFVDFYNLYNPLAMVVEPYRLRAISSTWGGERVDAQTGKNYVAMFESIHESNQLKIRHEQKHGFVYDRVIRIRPDLTFNPSRSLRDDLIHAPVDDRTFVSEYHKSGFNDNKLEDIYWIASSQAMDKICNFHEVRASSGSRGDWQVEMANWVKSPDIGLVIKSIGSPHDVRLLREKEVISGVTEWDKIPT